MQSCLLCNCLHPPCEVVVTQVLPSFRFLVAKELVTKYHYSQSDAAKRVGTTQAAISQYFDSKRGRRWSKQSNLLSTIKPFALSTAKQIAKGEVSMVDTIQLFCMFCQSIKRGPVCSIHRHDSLLPKTCAICKPVISL
jgi:predicted transcriptional regulator